MVPPVHPTRARQHANVHARAALTQRTVPFPRLPIERWRCVLELELGQLRRPVDDVVKLDLTASAVVRAAYTVSCGFGVSDLASSMALRDPLWSPRTLLILYLILWFRREVATTTNEQQSRVHETAGAAWIFIRRRTKHLPDTAARPNGFLGSAPTHRRNLARPAGLQRGG